MSKKCSALEGGACLASKAQSLEVWRVCGLRVHCCDEGRLYYKSNNSNNAPSPCKRAQRTFHVACVGRTTCQFPATCVSTCFFVYRGFWRGDFRSDEGNSHMRFTWPVWNKTHFVFAELANLLCEAFASAFRRNPCRKTKFAFLCGKTLDSNFGNMRLCLAWC